jgi:hypothetical protein
LLSSPGNGLEDHDQPIARWLHKSSNALRKTVERLMDIVQRECLGDALVLGPKGWCLKSKKVLYMRNSNSRRIVDGGEPGKGKVATSPSEVARVRGPHLGQPMNGRNPRNDEIGFPFDNFRSSPTRRIFIRHIFMLFNSI